ncbi:MAG: hypothetical protein L6E13_09500 [Firmicutes bacterium]|nr:hypothetical protein [Bacillota bacterium]
MPRLRRTALALLILGAATLAAGCARGPAAGSDVQGLRDEVRALSEQQKALTDAVQTLTEEVQRLQGGGGNAPGGNPSGKEVNRINPHYPQGVAGQREWGYHQETRADLDGDGAEEKLVVIARVGRPSGGQDYSWDDGQPWNVYVEEPDGTRTYVFADWVQLGQLNVGVTDDGDVVILELAGAGWTLYHVDYQGPGKFKMVQLAQVPVLRQTEPVQSGS